MKVVSADYLKPDRPQDREPDARIIFVVRLPQCELLDMAVVEPTRPVHASIQSLLKLSMSCFRCVPK
jgi:hypothetical protein